MCYPHFTDRETEAQICYVICSKSKVLEVELLHRKRVKPIKYLCLTKTHNIYEMKLIKTRLISSWFLKHNVTNTVS